MSVTNNRVNIIMRISTIFYVIKQGFKNITRNWMFSLASIVTMSACIFLFGIFYSMVTNLNSAVKGVEQGVTITVFFDEGLEQDKIDEIGEKITARPEVEKIDFISADQAWEDFKEQYFQGSEEAAEGFKDDNPLANQANYVVTVKAIEDQSQLVDYLEGVDGIRTVNQSESAANTLSSFNRLIAYVSIAIIAILLVVAIFLISNTISTGISIRREEIGIMKFIGATDGFVRAPFLLEGIILGLIGAAIPLGILYLGYTQVIKYLGVKFHVLTSGIDFVPVLEIFRVLLPVGLILGIGIGFIGSLMTTRKHLKV